MKAFCLLALFCLFSSIARGQTPRLAVPAGVSYGKVDFRDTQGDLFKTIFGPQPDTVGNYSVVSLSSGLLYVSQSGFGAKADLSIGWLAQKGVHFDSSDPRWSALGAASGLYAITDNLILSAGFHANSLYNANIKNVYLGFGLQAGIGITVGDLLLQIERLSDSEGIFDLFGAGHTELKMTRITLSYLFSVN